MEIVKYTPPYSMEYLKTTFTGENGTWELVATTSLGRNSCECGDEFRNIKTGARINIIRSKIYSMQQKKKIW